MKPSDEQWNRWLDGTLSPEEAEAMETAVEKDQSLAADQAFFSQFSEDLKQTFPAERTPPFPDFFNSHIQKQIRDLREAELAPKRRPAWWPDWFRMSWAVPLAAAAVVVVTLTQIGVIGGRSGSQIVYAYTPDESVTALTDYNKDANAVVVRLEGIEPLPDGFDLILADRHDPRDAATGPLVALYQEPTPEDGEDGFEDDVDVFVGPMIQFTSHVSTY